MDYLKLNLGPAFLRSMIARIIGKAIKKKLGCDIDILIKEIQVTSENGRTSVHLNLDAELSNEELTKLIKSIDLI